MPFLPLPDSELYYEVAGTGPALIFAHGLGGNHLSWWQQVPHFSARYTCVSFAHRGFAPSTDRSGRGPLAYVDDLSALVDHLAFADVRLVAQSMGGWTCLGYALREPSRVRALVMADTTGSATPPPEVRPVARPAGMSEPELLLRDIHPAAGERMAREQPALHFLYQQIDGLSYALDKPALRAKLIAMRTTTPERLRALTMPILCITGEEDLVIPPAAVAWFASVLPRARVARVPDAGHSVYFERALVFNRLVDDFLGEVP